MNEAFIMQKAPKPDHVPDALVFDFDFIMGADYLHDPFAFAEKTRTHAPSVFWTPRNHGHWVIASYETVSAGARDWEIFSSRIMPQEIIDMLLADMPKGVPTPMTALPASVDPPEHGLYRMPVNAAFSPSVAAGLKEEIRGLAVELIEAIKPAGRCELISAVTEPLPIKMFLKLFGLPAERLTEYRDVVKQLTNMQVHDPKEIMKGAQLLVSTYTDALIERRDNPGRDIISMMWKVEIAGKPMTLEVMQSYCLSLFLAGLDTVTNAMAFGTQHLATHPELQAEMRAEPSRIPLVTEELLRLYAFPLPIRRVARDGAFAGVQMKKGEFVHFYLAAANRDPAYFANPEVFMPERERQAHLTFGAGPHRCLGMHLARVELHVYYEELLSRLPSFRLDTAYTTTYHGGITMGPDKVHLIWD